MNATMRWNNGHDNPATKERGRRIVAARVAVRYDDEWRALYDRLLANGKASKAALCAVMHKLLRQIMGCLRRYYAEQADRPA